MHPADVVGIRTGFHDLFYGLAPLTWDNTYWLGKKCWKNPFDLWSLQEIIYELQPDFLIETGTFQGGAALFYATIMNEIKKGMVITIDINPATIKHPRIVFLQGSSTDPDIFNLVKKEISGIAALNQTTIIVALDSDHSKDHVLKEINLYSQLVSRGSYLIVEDTNTDGPASAVEEYLFNRNSQVPAFIQDRSREKFLMSFNPGGWLKRIR